MSKIRVQKDTVLPLLYPISGEHTKDGTTVSEIPLKRNTKIIVSLDAANRSELIWGEDAKIWRPERWLNEPTTSESVKMAGDDASKGSRPSQVSKVPLPGVYSGMYASLTCFGPTRLV